MKRYTALRYLGDEKYILMLAAIDNDKAIKAEEQAYSDLRGKLSDAYDILREMEFALKAEQDSLAQARKMYDNTLKDNRMGLTGFSDVESKKTDLQSKENSIYTMQVDLSKTIAMFNFYTSNYMENRFSSASADAGDYQSGGLTGAEGPMWTMRDTVADYKFEFGVVNLPEDLSITHYELYDNENNMVGARTQVGSMITHLPLTYSGSSRMVVKFYAGANYVAYSEFDGGLYGGELEIIRDTGSPMTPGPQVYGIFEVSTVAYRGEFSIMLDEMVNYDGYAVFYEGRQVGQRRQKGEKTAYVDGMFRDMERMEIAIYLGEAEILRLKLRQTGDLPLSGELYRQP